MDKKIKEFVKTIKQEVIKESIKIKLKPNTKVSITQSNIGGLFYLPKDKEISVNDKGQQLLFLAQINCEELPENSIYPKTGILQFWIFGGNTDMGVDYDNLISDNNKRVIYYPSIEEHFTEDELSDIYNPQIDEEEGELWSPIVGRAPFALSFKKINEAILDTDFRFDEILVEKWNEAFPDKSISSYYDLDDDIFEYISDELDTEDNTKIGGFGYFAQSDPRGEYEQYKDYTELLLQLDSLAGDDDEFEIMWGDCGVGNFFATKEQIKNLDFTNCLYTYDCC